MGCLSSKDTRPPSPSHHQDAALSWLASRCLPDSTHSILWGVHWEEAALPKRNNSWEGNVLLKGFTVNDNIISFQAKVHIFWMVYNLLLSASVQVTGGWLSFPRSTVCS